MTRRILQDACLLHGKLSRPGPFLPQGRGSHGSKRTPVRSLLLPSLLLSGLLLISAACVPQPRASHLGPLDPSQRIAILPLSNYTADRDVPDKVRPMLAGEIAARPGVRLVDPGAVEEALSLEPWLIFDRIPPDLLDRLGEQLGADAVLVGAILGSGYRRSDGDEIPHFSISLRLLQTPGGRVLWSVVHSRDGNDGEWLFGFGRVHNLEQLIEISVAECLRTFPAVGSVDSESAVSTNPGEGR